MIISVRFASMEWRILNRSHRQKMGSLPEGGELFPVFLVQNICVKYICRVIIQLV